MATCTGSAGLIDDWERDDTSAQPPKKIKYRRRHSRQLSAIDYLEGESDLLLKVPSAALSLVVATATHTPHTTKENQRLTWWDL